MNRAFLPFVKSLFVAMLAVSAVASAAEEQKAAKADPAKGEAIFSATCIGCHGPAGNSMIPTNPKLSGQHEAYIYKQLNNFKSPDRAGTMMTAFASTLSDDDMKNVAAYLSAQAAQPGAAKDKDIVEIGKKIYRGGIAEKSVAACAGCHSPNGVGIPAQFPRLAGQHQDYTIAQLTGFRSGARKNSPQMAAIAKRMSDDEIKAVADYVAGLK
jgi:cbb3-type cytochrome c oxidase subunit III